MKNICSFQNPLAHHAFHCSVRHQHTPFLVLHGGRFKPKGRSTFLRGASPMCNTLTPIRPRSIALPCPQPPKEPLEPSTKPPRHCKNIAKPIKRKQCNVKQTEARANAMIMQPGKKPKAKQRAIMATMQCKRCKERRRNGHYT